MELSIIIPVYNGKDFIDRLVRQAIEIACDKEIILVDDGSTDGSYKHCLKLYQDIEWIHVLRKENGGISSARNCGLDYATGMYVMFADQDDHINIDTISRSVKNAEHFS